VLVSASFSVGLDYDQPEEVVDLFESHRERLAGRHVSADSPGDPNELYVETTVIIPD
jgi:hypothetical protein